MGKLAHADLEPGMLGLALRRHVSYAVAMTGSCRREKTPLRYMRYTRYLT